MNRARKSSSKAHDREDPKSFWIVAVEIDRIALAVGVAGVMAVLLLNVFSEQSSSIADVMFRAAVTFVGLWLATFVLLVAMQRHLLAQLNAPVVVEEIPDEPTETALSENEEVTHEPAQEDVA